MSFSTNGPHGTGHPARPVEYVADQEIDEGKTGPWRHGQHKKRNPFREQHAHRGRERHDGTSARGKPSLVAALPAPKSTPGEQRGDVPNRTSFQVLFAFFLKIFSAPL